MLLITTCGDTYKPYRQLWLNNVKELGYDYYMGQLFNDHLDEHGFYQHKSDQHGYHPRGLHKPAFIQGLLNYYKDSPKHKYLIYLDTDAIPRARFDEILTDDYDIGVTYRITGDTTLRKMLPMVGLLNSGVVFLNNTPQTRQFVDDWLVASNELEGDQYALNTLLFPDCQKMSQCWQGREWVAFQGMEELGLSDSEIVTYPSGLRVKLFSSAVYNNYLFGSASPLLSKILHFKGHNKQLAEQQIEKYIKIKEN